MNICDSNFFPDYEMRPPSDANPLEIVVTSIPTTATLVLWILFESRKSGVYFTRHMIARAKLVCLAGSIAHGFLIWRIFKIFECESLFDSPLSWVAIPIAVSSIIQIVAVFSLFGRLARTCALFYLILAGCFAFGEFAGRNLHKTSAVQVLVPFQQIYCIFVVCFLTGVRKRSVAASDRNLRPYTSRGRNKTLKSIDPLQRRDGGAGGDDHEKWWS